LRHSVYCWHSTAPQTEDKRITALQYTNISDIRAKWQ